MSQDEDVVAFFLSLPKSRRRDYDALAALDRRYGEDVEAEVRAQPPHPGSPERSGSGS